MTLSPLTIRLFGPLQVIVQGEPMPRVRTRSVEWLLALLALRHGRAVSRAWLAGTLWPESEESQALQNLRSDLVRLRKALGPQEYRIQSPARDQLTLDLADAEVDLLHFDSALQAGDEESLRRAVAIYTAPLLEGCFEEWALGERETRAKQILMALETLAEKAQERGDYDSAIHCLRRAEQLDPLRDSLIRRLMVNLTAAGDPAAAIQTYRDFRIRLQEELLADPDEATTRLFQEIRSGARDQAAGGQTLPPVPTRSARPASSRSRHTPLPQPLTRLIGRDQEIREVQAHLRQSRLVTLVGTGGVGKTRLALELAFLREADSAGETVWVELAALTESVLVPQTVADAMGLREEPGRKLMETLAEYANSRSLLLILDNCEHLIEACAQLAERLLRACARITILATSRESLKVPGEQTYRVPSLLLPDTRQSPTAQTLRRYEASCLFVERAIAVKGDFVVTDRIASAVASLCHRLDGIPLAIELAAARIGSLSAEEINNRLDRRFRLLTVGSRTALPRQQTLKALIDWSYDLLNAPEKTLLARLSVFSGGWTLAAAEAVASDKDEGGRMKDESNASPSMDVSHKPSTDELHPSSFILHPSEVLDLLSSLVDKSLVLAEDRADSLRYRMLETVRLYGVEKLREGQEEPSVRRQHRDWYLALAEEAALQLNGPEQAEWLERLETEHDNLRHALMFCLEAPGEAQAGLRLAGAMQRFWATRGYLTEGRDWCEAVLKAEGTRERTAARARALKGAGVLAEIQGDDAAARTYYEQSLEVEREIGDRQGIAVSLSNLGNVAYNQGDYAEAQTYFEQSLQIKREIGDRRGLAVSLDNLGLVVGDQGDYATAQVYHQQSLEICREIGDRQGIANALGNLGIVAYAQSDYTAARTCFEQSLDIRRELGHRRGIASSLSNLGNVAYDQGEYAAACAYFEQSLEILQEMGNRRGIADALINLGGANFHLGDYAAARTCFEQSLEICREIRDLQYIIGSLEGFAHLACAQAQAALVSTDAEATFAQLAEDQRRAARLWGAAERLREEIGSPHPFSNPEEYGRNVEAIRRSFGAEAFSAAWTEGRAMTLEQAIAFAQGEAGEAPALPGLGALNL